MVAYPTSIAKQSSQSLPFTGCLQVPHPEGLKSALVSVSANTNPQPAVQPSTVAITSDQLTQTLPTVSLATVQAVAPTVVDTAFDAALNGRQVMPVSFKSNFTIRVGF